MYKRQLIDSVEVYTLSNPNDVKPHWVSHFIVPTANELLIKIKTKNGNSGFGMATSYTDITPIIKPFKNGLQDLIIGEDPFCPEKIYDKIFKLTDTKISSEKNLQPQESRKKMVWILGKIRFF